MGWFGPKALLTWREPRSIRHAREALEEKAHSRWARPLAVLLIAALVVVPALLEMPEYRGPTRGAFLGLLIAIAVGIFVVYVVPLTLRLVPAEIRVHETGISRQVANTGTSWRYTEMTGFRIAAVETKNGSLSILAVQLKKGEALIGIAPGVDIEQLKAILSEHGVGERPGGEA